LLPAQGVEVVMTQISGDGDAARAVADLLWGDRPQPSRGPKRSLSLARIAEVTVHIADTEGLRTLSMQRAAADLAVTKMALYRYVTSKAELLAITVEAAVESPPDLSEVPGGWRPQLETWARHLRAVWQRHPWLPTATLGDRVMGPQEVAWIEQAVTALADCGLTTDEQLDAVLVIGGHVRSTITAETTGSQPLTPGATNTALQARIHHDSDSYPGLLAAADHRTASLASTAAQTRWATDRAWEFGLRTFLHGLDAVITERRAATQPAEA
jgi:AcrR family transcriptional regulator